MKTKLGVLVTLSAVLLASAASRTSSRKELQSHTGNPYLAAIVVDAATGDVLFEDKADTQGYPASCIKLMDLLVILEKIEQSAVKLDDKVTITAESSTMGGSQVYLKEKEVFPVDDLLYALMVQSANDAAVALALQVAGSKDGFVLLMNEKAKALGMKSTEFHSCHGLPPAADQLPDLSTPRDLAILCLELLKHKDTLRYTSTKERPFRPGTPQLVDMRNHDGLLNTFPGCDGFKTGYFSKAGFSIAATAERNGNRVIAVVLGSPDKKTRDAKAAELLSMGFLELAKKQSEKAKPAK